MLKKIFFTLLFIMIVTSAFAGEEIYRIRLENRVDGLIQVSLNKGTDYYTLGSVKHPANDVGVGFMASGYMKGSSVAATATHAIRIKISPTSKYNTDFKNIKIFSIIPKEFWDTPTGFGGHVAGSSGIYTDINAGSSIFLNFSPFPESNVFIEYKGNLFSLSTNYIPQTSDVYVIVVEKPKDKIDYIDFDNIKNGNVTINSSDKKKNLTTVYGPMSAVGRYDGTTYNYPGQINTAHGGVITIATSAKFPYSVKEGDNLETRGGFMIQPIYHAIRQDETKPQVMTIGTDTTNFGLEGTEPLYSGYINLWYYPNNLSKSYYAKLKIDDKYWNIPPITGKIDNAFTKEYLKEKLDIDSKNGVTGVRLYIPEFDLTLATSYLNECVDNFNKNINKDNIDKNNIFKPKLKTLPKAANIYSFFVDGRFKGMTSTTDNIYVQKNDFVKGLHHLQIVATSEDGEETSESKYFYTDK